MKDKGLAEKVVQQIRQNGGQMEFGTARFAKEWSCAQSRLCVILRRLLDRDIIAVVGGCFASGRRSTIAMTEAFREGDSWLNIYRNKTSDDCKKENKSFATPPTDTKEVSGRKTEDIASRLSLLQEIVDLYQRLQKEQQSNAPLRAEIAALEEQNRILRSENALLQEQFEWAKKDRERHKQNAATMERELTAQRNQLRRETARVAPAKILMDGSGVMIERKAL